MAVMKIPYSEVELLVALNGGVCEMAVMKIPYSEIELLVAFELLIEKISLDYFERKMKELEPELSSSAPSDVETFNRKMAEYHGITVEQLLASPNIADLLRQFCWSLICAAQTKFKDKLGITDKEAWAIIAAGLGII